jgi:hypothetical protein
MIDKQLDILRQPRLKILNILESFSLEQLNMIPAGYNNNIIWNLGHMVAAQQGVCYKRAGVETRISDGFSRLTNQIANRMVLLMLPDLKKLKVC